MAHVQMHGTDRALEDGLKLQTVSVNDSIEEEEQNPKVSLLYAGPQPHAQKAGKQPPSFCLGQNCPRPTSIHSQPKRAQSLGDLVISAEHVSLM